MGYEPIRLKGERVWRTYIGGKNIGALHGDENPQDDHFPEEWMYSVTRARNVGREEIEEGICRIDDGTGRTLKELIEKDPGGMLGARHVFQWGSQMGVLIKLIDSKERLTIQVHPNKSMAKALFGSPFGKTECWHILDTRPEEACPCIYLGFREGISREEWEACFQTQDIEKMISLLNRIPVKKGDTYLVKGGVPHAIGAGCLLIEVQEPTDYTIRVERTTPGGFVIDDQMCHQGLGFARMFDCFLYQGMSAEEVRDTYRIRPERKEGGEFQLIRYQDTPCFRMEELEIRDDIWLKGEGEFYCLYVLQGEGQMESLFQVYPIFPGSQFFIPAECERYCIKNIDSQEVKLLKIYGPDSADEK